MVENPFHILRHFLNFMLFNLITDEKLERLDEFQILQKNEGERFMFWCLILLSWKECSWVWDGREKNIMLKLCFC